MSSSKMKLELQKLKSDQQYDELPPESDSPLPAKHKLDRKKMTSMAPNFRVIKFIHLEIQKNKPLNRTFTDLSDSLDIKPRPLLMKIIANTRHQNSNFNLPVQNLTILDFDLSKKLKEQGKTNEEISTILEKDKDIINAVKLLVSHLEPIIKELSQ